MEGYYVRGGRPSHGAAEPEAVLEAAMAQLRGAQAAGPPPFIPAARFEGRKPGYYFGTARQGVGYYLDAQQPAPAMRKDGTLIGEGEEEEEQEEQQQEPQLAPEDLLRQAEEQAAIDDVQLLDAKSLKSLINQLNKKVSDNLALRVKHADDPMKFLDNEVDLLSIIRSIMQVAGSPELYPVLVEGSGVSTLMNLLPHDNTDIGIEVLELFKELTDADAVEDNADEARALVDAMLDAGGAALLVDRLTVLDESQAEEATAVHNVLSIAENMMEVRSDVAEVLLDGTPLLKWLLSRIRARPSDTNKQYASEILAILMQGHEVNQRRLAQSNGIDALLLAISPFKGRDPADDEEAEFLENCFDALCSCLLLPEHKAIFVQVEGVELMYLLLKAKRPSRHGAIKLLDFATTRCQPACERFVDAGGLAQLFGIFMGRSKVKGPKGRPDREVEVEMEERCVSIISNLFQGLGKGSRRDRLCSKFVESEFEKADRLMELLFRYDARVAAAEARLLARTQDSDDSDSDGPPDADEVLLERLDAGLFTLQQCCVVAAGLWATGDSGLRKRLLALLHLKGQTLEGIRDVLSEYYLTLSNEPPTDERDKQQQRLQQLLEAVGVDVGTLVSEGPSDAADTEAADTVAVGAERQQQEQGGQGDGEAGIREVEMEEEDGEVDVAGYEEQARQARQQQEEQRLQQQLEQKRQRQQQEERGDGAALANGGRGSISGDEEAADAADRHAAAAAAQNGGGDHPAATARQQERHNGRDDRGGRDSGRQAEPAGTAAGRHEQQHAREEHEHDKPQDRGAGPRDAGHDRAGREGSSRGGRDGRSGRDVEEGGRGGRDAEVGGRIGRSRGDDAERGSSRHERRRSSERDGGSEHKRRRSDHKEHKDRDREREPDRERSSKHGSKHRRRSSEREGGRESKRSRRSRSRSRSPRR